MPTLSSRTVFLKVWYMQLGRWDGFVSCVLARVSGGQKNRSVFV